MARYTCSYNHESVQVEANTKEAAAFKAHDDLVQCNGMRGFIDLDDIEVLELKPVGIDHTGNWTAEQHVIDMQYSHEEIAMIARLGSMDEAEEAADMTAEQRAAVVAYCQAQSKVFTSKNYSIELVDGQFVLVHPTSGNEVFDSFEELVEAHPICEEARVFFFCEAE